MEKDTLLFIVGLFGAAFLALLPIAVPMRRRTAALLASVCVISAIYAAREKIGEFIYKLHGNNVGGPIWYPYALGIIVAFGIISWSRVVISSYTRLRLHIKNPIYNPDKHWWSPNIVGYYYSNDTRSLFLAFHWPININGIKVAFETERDMKYKSKKINSRCAVIEFERELAIQYIIVTAE